MALEPKHYRMIALVVVLLAILIGIFVWLGGLDSAGSDEDQIRDLISATKDEINDHDWDDLMRLTNVPSGEHEAWKKQIPMTANFVTIDAIRPKEYVDVPSGATEYSLQVTVVAHADIPGTKSMNLNNVEGTIYFVKVEDVWRIDMNRSVTTFPYLPSPP